MPESQLAEPFRPLQLSEVIRGLSRNYKLNARVNPRQVVDAITIANVKFPEASKLAVASGTATPKNKAYIFRKTQRPVYIIKVHHKISYDYIVRNYKLKR